MGRFSVVKWLAIGVLLLVILPVAESAAQNPKKKGDKVHPPGIPPASAALTPDLMKPGAKLALNLPALGGSARTSGAEPVQMMIVLPSNYDRNVAHPVLFHFGGDAGSPDPKTFNQLCGGKDFICAGVDFSSGGQNGFRNAHAALTVLAQATKIDQKSIFIGGSSAGAYCTTNEIESPLSAPFAGFICMIGGDGFNPQVLGRRPILWYAGEKDVTPSGSRVQIAMQAHQQLKAAGCDSTIVIEPGGVHDVIVKTLKPKFQEWISERLPAVQEVKRLESQLNVAKTDAAKLVIYRKLAQSTLDLPIVGEAKQKVAEADAAKTAAKTPATPSTPPAKAAATEPSDKPATEPSEKPKATAAERRTWSDTTGKFRIEAELVEIKAGKARLKKNDGTIAEIPLDKLSQEDRQYLQSR